MAFIQPQSESVAKIKVVGVGGGGQNAVSSMIETNKVNGVEFIVMNTDIQVLDKSPAPVRVQLGPERTRGLGAGANPVVGFEAAQESLDDIMDCLEGADMIFLAVTEGGGTGTGAAPIVAKVAKETGALTIAVVTKPFTFEGKKRMTQADEGIRQLKGNVDALVVIPNDRILEIVDQQVPFTEAFKLADEVIGKAVEGISDLITNTGLINVDFADVKAVMTDAGSALMGIGEAVGEGRAQRAAMEAINSPLLNVDITGSTGILLNIVGDNTLTMHEVNTAAQIVTNSSHENANIIMGSSIDPNVDGIKVTVIATGFDSAKDEEIAFSTKNGSISTNIDKSADKKTSPILSTEKSSIDEKLTFIEKKQTEKSDATNVETEKPVENVNSTVKVNASESTVVTKKNYVDVEDSSTYTPKNDYLHKNNTIPTEHLEIEEEVDDTSFDLESLRAEIRKQEEESLRELKTQKSIEEPTPVQEAEEEEDLDDKERRKQSIRRDIESSGNFWSNLAQILRDK